MPEPFDLRQYADQFPEEPLTGPARLIYEQLLRARPATKSCAAAIKQALNAEFPSQLPPDAPQLVVPDAVMKNVSCTPFTVPGQHGPVRSLVFRPLKETVEKPPVVVYFHGGGWSLGDPEEAELLTRKLALVSGCVIISVDYRLAPEYPYPCGLDDAVSVYRWVRETRSAEWKVNADKVAVGGDSSGGNFAAALTLRMRDEGRRVPDANLLLCPATHFLFEKFASFRRYGTKGFLYDAAFIGAVRGFYAPYALWEHPYLSPINGDLRGFPPTLIIGGSVDPLIDDNRAFFAKVRAETDQEVELIVYQDMPHAFYYFLGLTKEEDQCYQAMGAFLRRVLK